MGYIPITTDQLVRIIKALQRLVVWSFVFSWQLLIALAFGVYLYITNTSFMDLANWATEIANSFGVSSAIGLASFFGVSGFAILSGYLLLMHKIYLWLSHKYVLKDI